VPPPPGPATPVGPTDWAAVRRFGAALLRRALEARPGIARPGSRGPFVRTVQASLNAIADVGLVEDGSYGPATEAAVRRFQGFARLDVDGIVGPRTVDGLRWFLRMIEDGKA
jgi:peptidoglycan hydrolase-like protein with peptidoglycan-binding domain